MCPTIFHSLKVMLSFCLAIVLAGCISPSASGSAPAQGSPVPNSTPPKEKSAYSDPFAYCPEVGTSDAPDARYTGPKIPDSIVQAMIKQGIVSADAPAEFQKNAVWRCMDHSVWVCHFGANLPCEEKADASKSPSSAMQDFCKANPSADNIPAALTGRATVFGWVCRDGKPEADRQIFTVDPQGYLAEFWYKLTPP